MLKNLQAIVLAGGISKQFQTGKTKLLEKICGTELILYPVHLLKALNIPITIVTGIQHEQIQKTVKKICSDVSFVLQEAPMGTGHAALLTKNLWKEDNILLMNADIPLITPDIINKLYRQHVKTDADISFITAHGEDLDTTKYARVVIQNNKIQVSAEPITDQTETANQCCVSAGIYIAKKSFLNAHINKLSKHEKTGKFYLPELVKIASDHHCKIITTSVSFEIVRSVDTLADLWTIEHIKRSQLLLYWMNNGVRFANTLNVLIDDTVILEQGCYIGSGAILLGHTHIKAHSNIGAFSQIEDSIIETNSIIPPYTIIQQSIITQANQLQPFSFINQNAKQTEHAKINFTGTRKITKHPLKNHLKTDCQHD